MTKKTLFGFVLLGLFSIALGFGTYSWFTSQATNKNNIFQTGELIIGTPYEGENDGFISTENLVPGSRVTGTVTVKNLGDVVFKYKVMSSRVEGDENLYNKLYLVINDGTRDIYNGQLIDLNKEIGKIFPDNSQTLQFTISLPEDADNYYQGKFALVKFTFNATQIENSGWTQ